MIDRSYLPYESARTYIDRGMAKWMGFFISEHFASLAKKENELQTMKETSNAEGEKTKEPE